MSHSATVSDKIEELREFTFDDLERAVEHRARRLSYKRERCTGVSSAIVNRVRRAKTDRERRKILSQALTANGEHLDDEVQDHYFQRYRTSAVRGGAIGGSRREFKPFRLDKIALARLRALPDTFTVAQVIGTPTRPAWSLLRAWEGAGRVEVTGRAGEWRKL